MMRALYALRDFLLPPMCPGCYEIFSARYGEKNEMCSDCKIKWELLKATVCPECGDRFSDCKCMPRALSRAGCSALLKLVPYKKKRAVSNNTVLYIKKKRDSRVFEFLSSELSRVLDRYIKKLGIRKSDALILYCPRRRGALNEFGFDQAKLLAKGISELTGIRLVSQIKRTDLLGRAQKKLDAKGRSKNVRGAFMLSGRVDLKNKTVFLVDDLVTTGSTMAESAGLVKRAGAALIVGVCVAYTEKDEIAAKTK